ncbi:MAG: tetratricopeptide repeat protein [Acidobacteriia bacterium]|nr:tetratricopeptide repeat protein [Terriglobia bacterium]
MAPEIPSAAQRGAHRLARYFRSPLDLCPSDPALFVFVLLITFLCYIRTLNFDFVFDDEILIVNNPRILSAGSIPGYFTQHLTQFLNPAAPGNYYRPVQLLWLLWNRTLWGLRPFGWHLSVVALHALAAGLVYLLARALLQERPAACVAAGVFALHPVHVESAAWAMGFIDPLFTVLLLVSFLCYLKARERPTRRALWMSASVLSYALAAFAKEPALVLPLLIFSHSVIATAPVSTGQERTRFGRLRGGLVAATPYLAVTAAYLAARWAVLRAFSHDITSLPLGTLLATLPRVLWSYIKLLVWPVGLSAFYDVPYVQPWEMSRILLPAAAVAAAAVGLWFWSRRSAVAAVATSWLALPLLILLNLRAFPQDEIVHDRYLYLASVGFALLVGLAWSCLRRVRLWFLASGPARAAAAIALLTLFGAQTIYYSRFWTNNQALYARGITIAPNNNLVTNNLAGLYVARGDYPSAIALYQRVIARNRSFWLSTFNLGYCFNKLGRLEEAERYLRRAAAIDSTRPDSYLYLGLVCWRSCRMEEAEANFRRALALRPVARGYHFALGMVLKLRGAWAEARREFQLELVNDPGQAEARGQLSEIDAHLSPAPRRPTPKTSP